MMTETRTGWIVWAGAVGAVASCVSGCTATSAAADSAFAPVATSVPAGATGDSANTMSAGSSGTGMDAAGSGGGETPSCGNSIIDPGEICDGADLGEETCQGLGFEIGDLACTANCGGFALDDCGWFECGNGTREGEEACDGTVGDATCVDAGFDNGTVFCTMGCEFDTVMCGTCGDGLLDPAEDCENKLALGETCQGLGYDSGELSCGRDCLFNVSACQLCGNGAAEGTETCDGEDLTGATCATLGLSGGDLACADTCNFDLANCDITGIPFGSDGFYTGLSLVAGALPCDDITASGTDLSLSDDSTSTVPVGFNFALYGVDYTQVTVSSNGTINFGGAAATPSYTNACFPYAGTGSNNLLMAWWDDLNPSADLSASVRYETLGAPGGQRLIVQWDTPFFSSGDSTNHIVFRVALHEGSNAIDVCYVDTQGAAGDLGNAGGGGTAGIQQNSVTGLQFGCNSATLTDGLLLSYIPI